MIYVLFVVYIYVLLSLFFFLLIFRFNVRLEVKKMEWEVRKGKKRRKKKSTVAAKYMEKNSSPVFFCLFIISFIRDFIVFPFICARATFDDMNLHMNIEYIYTYMFGSTIL